MMIASGLPSFEIPTGLMTTGLGSLRGFGRGLRGMGSVDVMPLAQAFRSGQVNPNYGPSVTSPSAFAGAVPTFWPSSYFPDLATANQIAALLGASVVSLPVEYAGGSLNVPTAYWVRTPDGDIRVSDIIQAAHNNTRDLCTIAQQLAMNIPGGSVNPTCAQELGITQVPTDPFTGQPFDVTGIVPSLTNPLPTGAGSTLAPGSYVGVVDTPVPVTTTPVTTAAPTGTGLPAFSASDTCSTVQSKIGLYQQNGQSNIAIWSQIPATLAACPAVKALNPQATVYTTPASQTTQPGALNAGGGLLPANGSQGNNLQKAENNTGALYVGLGIAALVAVFAFGGMRS